MQSGHEGYALAGGEVITSAVMGMPHAVCLTVCGSVVVTGQAAWITRW
jgi:hypothetical protein